MALGIERMGFAASPAATATCSTPPKAKTALRSTGKEAKKASGTADANVFSHYSWVLPVAESDAVVVRPAAEIKNYGENEETDDGDNLDG
jgi:hypothetical protein